MNGKHYPAMFKTDAVIQAGNQCADFAPVADPAIYFEHRRTLGTHHHLHINLRKWPSGRPLSAGISFLKFLTGPAISHTFFTSGDASLNLITASSISGTCSTRKVRA